MDNNSSKCGCCQMEVEPINFAKIEQIIDKYKNTKGSLIQVLHAADTEHGYLPAELQKFIAQKMNIPLPEVYGVVTFYSFFSTKPKGRNSIRVCMGTACYVKGSQKLVDKLKSDLNVNIGKTTDDGNFSLDVMRCIGACGLAPVLTVNDKVYQKLQPEKLQEILDEYK